ncbi:MAG: glycosyltransferase family 4 protein [Synechococcales bacterium]|nr:glycosyltransferase family 4 protein [Synechococcales bacterium]
MKIAQLAPLWERVPPKTYGGIELVVSLLTEELIRRGHEVTLFASGDSETKATLEAVHPRAIRLDAKVQNYKVYELLQLNRAYERAEDFDIIHSHMGYAALSHAKLVRTPTLHTLHGDFDADREKIYDEEQHQPFVSISNAQRRFKPNLNYVATIYNGIDLDSHQFFPKPNPTPYLAFLGRMCEEKGAHLAIEIARKAEIPLKMAGKIDDEHREYYGQKVEPFVDGKFIQFLGEVDHEEKNRLLGGAIATLFPITWNEPFGLVMIESMAAGTPVIAMRMGSTPEVVADRKTGFLCDRIEGCVEAVAQVARIHRPTCRQHVAQRFSVAAMVDGYEAVYRQMLSRQLSRQVQGDPLLNPQPAHPELSMPPILPIPSVPKT